jgi:hypothetical protein
MAITTQPANRFQEQFGTPKGRAANPLSWNSRYLRHGLLLAHQTLVVLSDPFTIVAVAVPALNTF